MRYVIVIFCLALSQFVKAQVKEKYLIGTWSVCNEDNSYYKADTIILHQDINYKIVEEKACCHFIDWVIESRKRISIEGVFFCSEPGRVRKSNERERIRILKSKQNQIIEITRNGVPIDRFNIIEYQKKTIDRYPYEIKMLKLKREGVKE